MNTRLSSIVFSSLLISLLFMLSCTDPCDAIYCAPDQGECFDGDCICLVKTDTVNGQVVTTYWGGDSCNINLCLNVPCVNGDCIWGTCECIPGFDGDSCDFLLRGPYIDSFAVTEFCSFDTIPPLNKSYNTYIAPDTTDLEHVFITNFFYDSTSTQIRARATAFGLEIDTTQSININGTSFGISGASTAYDSLSLTMDFIYNVTDANGNVSSCSALFIKL